MPATHCQIRPAGTVRMKYVYIWKAVHHKIKMELIKMELQNYKNI